MASVVCAWAALAHDLVCGLAAAAALLSALPVAVAEKVQAHAAAAASEAVLWERVKVTMAKIRVCEVKANHPLTVTAARMSVGELQVMMMCVGVCPLTATATVV